jgi:hypothetical protein
MDGGWDMMMVIVARVVRGDLSRRRLVNGNVRGRRREELERMLSRGSARDGSAKRGAGGSGQKASEGSEEEQDSRRVERNDHTTHRQPPWSPP